jgi:MoaA/NifB/PqqE/SkfB family radical SAM enzyme
MAQNYLATRFTCSWPWSTLILLCDGRVVCGCSDPYAKRVLGDARRESIADIWQGPTIRQLRDDIRNGGSSFCGDCPLKLPLEDGAPIPQRPLPTSDRPPRLYVECTAACNISCFQSCCAPETGITRTRQAGMLDFDLFTRVIDEAGPSLGRVDFFNYGEAFLHKRAVEMCEYIKTTFPHIYLYSSTNGLALDDARVRRLVRSGIDEVTFSIDGASQDAYVRYRQRGNFDKALANLRAAVDEKRRNGLELPFINWRYILFTWNDNDREMERARALAAEIGVDRLCWEITDHPEDSFSRRFAPGSDDHDRIRHQIWDQTGLGNAIPGATPRARIELRDVPRGAPIVGRAGEVAQLTTRIRNLSQRPFKATMPHGRRLVRLGAQLAASDGSVIAMDHARAWLPHTIESGDRADVAIEVPLPASPGRYQLRFDLVSEGIDWFETCGSEVMVRDLVVAG